MAVYSPHKIAIPRRNMGPAPTKLRGRNPRHETPVSALIESIGWKSFLPLRAESNGITSRLEGRWPFLPLSLECKSKSFATLNLLWHPTYFKALYSVGHNCLTGVVVAPPCLLKLLVSQDIRLHNRRRWWSLLYDTRSETGCLCGIFLVVGNTKSVTIGAVSSLGPRSIDSSSRRRRSWLKQLLASGTLASGPTGRNLRNFIHGTKEKAGAISVERSLPAAIYPLRSRAGDDHCDPSRRETPGEPWAAYLQGP